MKPIETVYDNCRFRSRTEARWAVFFNAAEIRYQYEPQGYTINGRNYLPDFWLTDFRAQPMVMPHGTFSVCLERAE